jgi:tRNA(fMet)-specific endonuclease VapC
MNGRYLLDSNVIIALFAKDPGVHGHVAKAKEIFIPCIAIGELYFGAYKSRHAEKNLQRIDELALDATVLPCDATTARIYGQIKHRLKERGQPIPENDIWIAAIAQQYRLTLITKDSHFNVIENLTIETW